jgi:serine/threonine protein phosphatase 1
MRILDSSVLEFVARERDRAKLIAAVGDLHAYPLAAQTAVEVIETLGLQGVFLGDYLDRGPSSRKTIRTLRKAKARHCTWRFLLGNHEHAFLRSIVAGRDFLQQPGSAFEEYGGVVPAADHGFLQSLLPYFQSENLLFVHGGIGRDVHLPVEQQEIETLIWSYGTASGWSGRTVVCGHRLVDQPEETHNCVSLETGVWRDGGVLSVGLVSDAPNVERRLRGVVTISADGDVLNAKVIG